MIYVDGDLLDDLAASLLHAVRRLTNSDGLRLAQPDADEAHQRALAELLVKNALGVLHAPAYDLVERRGVVHSTGGLTFGKT